MGARQSQAIPATDSAGRLVGYAYASWYRMRSGYRFTCEDSVYVSPSTLGRDVGRLLLDTLIQRCTAMELGVQRLPGDQRVQLSQKALARVSLPLPCHASDTNVVCFIVSQPLLPTARSIGQLLTPAQSFASSRPAGARNRLSTRARRRPPTASARRPRSGAGSQRAPRCAARRRMGCRRRRAG